MTSADQIDQAIEIIRDRIERGMEVAGAPAECAVRFHTGKREEELAGMLAALVTASLMVTQFREIQSDLEDAFMMVTRTAEEEEKVTR